MAQRVDPSRVSSLQQKKANIRNICILAHVDHGKTTLCDHLISSNGVISPKLAGQLRFLDSTEEERRREITIHSSAISLVFTLQDRSKDSSIVGEDYLINLIDCPGHIDFSTDVSTSTRISDGALIVVDVVEGVCTQTRAVLQKALKDRMRPCLVINKIDKLCLELNMTPVDAFIHIRKVIENVNAIAAQLLNAELQLITDQMDSKTSEAFVRTWAFYPELGNVLFCSAIDSWGFGVAKFAAHWAEKLGLSRQVMIKYMFEDYTYIGSSKKLVKCVGQYSSCKPLFASLILEPLWKIYHTAITENNPEKAVKMAKRVLEIDIPSREASGKDPRSTAQAIFRRWLPLAEAMLRMVVRVVPGPVEAQKQRIDTFYPSSPCIESLKLREIYDSVMECRSGGTDILAPQTSPICNQSDEIVVFVTKMMPVRIADLKREDMAMLREKWSSNPGIADIDNDRGGVCEPWVDGEVMMALVRVFCGNLKPDRDLYLLGHRYDPLDGGIESVENMNRPRKIPAGTYALYICFGPSIFPIDNVPAGNIVGIVGLDSYISKTATISSTKLCHPMQAITFQAIPMVRVAVEPVSHSDLKKLEVGLQHLYQYDPAVEMSIDSDGQFTMNCMGELHVEQCINTLQNKLCKCELKVSEPLVPFKESLSMAERHFQRVYQLPPPWGLTEGVQSVVGGSRRFLSCGGQIAMVVRCLPLLDQSWEYFRGAKDLETLIAYVHNHDWKCERDFESEISREVLNDVISGFIDLFETDDLLFEQMFNLECDSKKSKISDFLHRLLSFDANKNVPNMLLLSPAVEVALFDSNNCDRLESSDNCVITDAGFRLESGSASRDSLTSAKISFFNNIWSRLNNSVVAGFQSATRAGPLMREAMGGVVFVLEKIELSATVLKAFEVSTSDIESIGVPNYTIPEGVTANFSLGQLISDVTAALRISLLASPVRIIEPVYSCELQCDQSQLGNLYAVLSKRRGTILEEDIIEGTPLFILSATLPVAESFGFAQELLERTSGSAISPQLTFSHWVKIDVDPFWKPSTSEELEDYGDQTSIEYSTNIARDYIDSVRKRKGLPVEERIVKDAEKQRTLSKKK